jgi:hypothetical protein
LARQTATPEEKKSLTKRPHCGIFSLVKRHSNSETQAHLAIRLTHSRTAPGSLLNLFIPK